MSIVVATKKVRKCLYIAFLLTIGLLCCASTSPLYAMTTEDLRNIIAEYPWYGTEEICGEASSGPANLTVGKNFSLGPNDEAHGKERRVNLIKALMADFGLTAAQGAGVVGNFMAESGGPWLPPDVNEGKGPGPPAFHGGYGWAQWTGGRQINFIAFAIAPTQGYMASANEHANDAANYAYLKAELADSQKVTITELKKQSTPEDAAVSFEHTFERAGKPVLEKRKAFAKQAFDEYNGGGSTSGDSSTDSLTSSGCTSTAGLADCGDVVSCAKKIQALAAEGKLILQAGKAQVNIDQMARGEQITACNPPGAVVLNVTLLQLLIKLSANFKIVVHNFSSPGHGCDYPKFHPRGRAMDVHLDGVPADGAGLGNAQSRAFAQAVMDALPPGGGLGQEQYIGPLQNTAGKRYFEDGPAHFHIDVGKDAPGGGA